MVGLRLFLPESWTSDPVRLAAPGCPMSIAPTGPTGDRAGRDRPGARGRRALWLRARRCRLWLSAPLRQALTERGLIWAAGIPFKQKVYPADVAMIFPVAGCSRPRQRHIPDVTSVTAQAMLETARWRTVSWRRETKGRLSARLAASASGLQTVRPSGSTTSRPASARRGGLGDRRAPVDGRAQILPLQPARRYRSQTTRRRHQGTLDLRIGTSAAQRRAGPSTTSRCDHGQGCTAIR